MTGGPENAHERDHDREKDPELIRREPVSFVRRGARMTTGRQAVWDRMAETVLVDVPRHRAATSVAPDAHLDWDAAFGRHAPLLVDIGSGLGESTAQGAADHPDWNVLSVEVYLPGLAALMAQVESRGLENVRAVEANAPELLDHLLPAGSAQEVWVFFPDPWHKKRHHKRRLVNAAFADRVARVLAPGGVLRLATDWSGYAVQMREVMESHPDFVNLHPGRAAGEESPLTRVRREGRELEVGAQPLPAGFDPARPASELPERAGLGEAVEASLAEDPVDHDGGWAPRFEGRPLTQFEGKALRAGRLVFDLAYARR
ncbi:tRNA (guanosine(46)-N7)-methyltransferase TrmB [Micrococcus porci]|uniref:tRNA (guanosine(46)-N7)-methyltransferase TrmB n=1 Tax=Micrococcus TaxID=1269 RepID=UPI001CC9428D|nr:tRNA (guanosine(46)-N7)-methyltransferase TrmB [Micrococcus porci]MCG7423441.1 tRNA (guanosine(46)-N7)-methyltransferase TrmB [Micrococcus sp. ACRRV]UBH25485.1 tRNA (guanosine(46)-N7)-methyltransferase TrmB [Micrococcus porci]